MGIKFLLFAFFAALITSCSTYKAGQTPDDVYYSPVKDYVAKPEKELRRDRYEEYISAEDDRYLRMKIRNRDRWSELDDYTYWNDSRYNHCGNVYLNNNDIYYNRYGNRYNGCMSANAFRSNYFGYGGYNYFGYGGYYTPLYPVVFYKSPKVYTGTTGKANLSTYRNTNYDNRNYNYSKGSTQNNNFGNLMKRVFSETGSSGNQSTGSTWDRPVRTYESGTTTNSNAGGRSGGYNSTGTSTSTKRDPR